MHDSSHTELIRTYGAVIGGSDLAKMAGFRNSEAMAAAARRGKLGFSTFPIKGRKGRFALVRDVADWLNKIKANGESQNPGAIDMD